MKHYEYSPQWRWKFDGGLMWWAGQYLLVAGSPCQNSRPQKGALGRTPPLVPGVIPQRI